MADSGVSTFELVRLGLLFVHLLAFAAAFVGIAFGDHALFARRRIVPELLRSAMRMVVLALAVLWITGLALVALDTGFVWRELLARPKLLAKLSVVLLLSANGWLLHHWIFPRMQPDSAATRAQALSVAGVASVLGGFSAVSWLVAAFVGIGKPVTAALGYGGFMALYALALLAVLPLAWWVVRPRLAQRLLRRQAADAASTDPGALGIAVR
jgi:hypothetical protein